MDLRELAAQLRKPQGKGGIEIGQVMNKGNALLNDWAIDELALGANDHVLEVGMGNGYFVSKILEKDETIRYTGYDYSTLMVEEAKTINSAYGATGKARFILGNADDLPFDEDEFSKILTVNTIYFWSKPEATLLEFQRVLKHDGILVVGVRSKETMDQMPFTEYNFRKFTAVEMEDLLINNGFKILKSIKKKEPPLEYNGQQMELENIIIKAGPVKG